MKTWGALVNWLDERVKIRAHIEKNLTGYMVPADITIWHSLGSVLLCQLAILFFSGILLLVAYVPDASKSFESLIKINNEIPYGWYVRRLHGAAANLFILALLLHMASTLFMGAYKKPRELQWLTGMALLGLGLGAALTGYLLPWSQLSYWATTVATTSIEILPYIGKAAAEWLRGGEGVTPVTLGRFFALHVWVMPGLFLLLVSAHIFGLRQTGIAPIPWKDERAGKIPFFPHVAVEDLSLIFAFLALLAALIFIVPQWSFPPDAWEPANPVVTPAHIKPEWYFLANYQFLKIVPSEILGIFAQILAGLLLFFLPFLDRGPERNPARRPVFLLCAALGVLVFIGLSVWGKVS